MASYFEGPGVDSRLHLRQRSEARNVQVRKNLALLSIRYLMRPCFFDSETNRSLPAGAVISGRKMAVDARAEPQYGERVPYVITYGEPNKQADRALEPEQFLADRFVATSLHCRRPVTLILCVSS
jgi:hypothetical protein